MHDLWYISIIFIYSLEVKERVIKSDISLLSSEFGYA